uniref:EOG090X07RL n=1 Tax=Daphnia hispanica TaxID=575233 RepID=A0A4Y7M7U4_9CRUS|nr:EOG090X07RL [Daphnia hispanica]
MAVPRRGVLRHHKQLAESEVKDKFEDLLVFGYACKLFRDDERAAEIDQGKLLIPWMGDDSIKIDRYDARGTLFDLKSHETPQGGYDRTEELTSEEKRVERLCDEERYFALYKDEEEEAVIKEEEIKRLNQDLNEVTSEEVSYHQVPFSYSNSSEVSDPSLNSREALIQSTLGQLGDAVYVPPPILDVPPDIIVPPTQKLARIIEKTANFISSQGTQMEIIVKAKQANNPMFQFLHFDTALHPFYRHILAAIRNGNYVVPAEDPVESDEKEECKDNGHVHESDSESENYLHPSLQPKASDQVDHRSSEADATEDPIQPSPDVRLLMDKTASYISRNGRHLESVVQSKDDPRFVFLNPEHAFHGYYTQKLSLYCSMQLNLETTKQLETSNQLVETKIEIREKSPAERSVIDPELMKTERRKKAALFLDQMKRDRLSDRKSRIEDHDAAGSESTSSSAKNSKSCSPDDIEIIGAVAGETRERSRSRSLSRSPSESRPERKRRDVRRRSRTRSRSRLRHRSVSRTRRRSRERSRSRNRPIRRSPSPERRRRQHKKHRSRERRRKEKKKRHSRDRLRKRRRHRSRSRSASDSLSRSRSRSRSGSRVNSSRSASESRVSPITSAVRKLAADAAASKSCSEASSPLPSQLLTIQPAFAKIAEGIRAKVIAMIEGDKK